MGKRFLVLVALWLFCVSLGANRCLTELNRAIGPKEELRAFRLEAVSQDSYRVDIFGLSWIVGFPPGLHTSANRLREEAGARLADFKHFLAIQP